jgi:hypothetical protein
MINQTIKLLRDRCSNWLLSQLYEFVHHLYYKRTPDINAQPGQAGIEDWKLKI